jgi:hypothetical protein
VTARQIEGFSIIGILFLHHSSRRPSGAWSVAGGRRLFAAGLDPSVDSLSRWHPLNHTSSLFFRITLMIELMSDIFREIHIGQGPASEEFRCGLFGER